MVDVFQVRDIRPWATAPEMRAKLAALTHVRQCSIRERILLAVLAAVRPPVNHSRPRCTVRPRWPSAAIFARRWRCFRVGVRHRTRQ